jgi:hypothetical protein
MSFLIEDEDNPREHVYNFDRERRQREIESSAYRARQESYKAADERETIRENSDARKLKERAVTEANILAAWEAYKDMDDKENPDKSPADKALEDNLYTLTHEFFYARLYKYETPKGGFATMGSAETVDDFVQDAMLKLWQVIRKGGIEGSYIKYLQTTMKNARSDFYSTLKGKKAEETGLDASVGEREEVVGTSNDTHGGHFDGTGNVSMSSAVFQALYGQGWDEHGQPLESVGSRLAPRFDLKLYLPYLYMLPVTEYRVLHRLLFIRQEDGQRTKRRHVAEELDRSIHWVNGKVNDAMEQLTTYHKVVKDHNDAWMEIKDDEVTRQARARIALRKRELVFQPREHVFAPQAPATRSQAAYALAAQALVTLYFDGTFDSIQVDSRSMQMHGDHWAVSPWDSERVSLLMLAAVAAESEIRPELLREELSCWPQSLCQLADYYASRFMDLLNWANRQQGKELDEVDDRVLAVASKVAERTKPRQWAIDALGNEEWMSDFDAAKLFVRGSWEAIEALSLALLDRGSLMVNEVRAIVAGVHDNEQEQAAMLEEVTAA